jgi:penicillin-binding protein 1B
LFGLGLAGILYMVKLDQVVRAKFEGKRWALPARVYARPLELYAGKPLTADELEQELQRLSYTKVRQPQQEGTYSRTGQRVAVLARPFTFPDGEEPGGNLHISFEEQRIRALRDAVTGKELALIRLEAPLIASIYPTHQEDRILLQRQGLPDHLVKALLAVEDRNFYDHFGVDPKGIARALWANLRAGAVVEGGSTLTQQLVKNFYLTRERTLLRKLNEAGMALILDWRYPKDEILTAYANEIYLGQDGNRAIHGFGLASRFYFNRPLEHLNVKDTALLIGMIKGPSYYNPRRHPQRALKRRNLIIDILVEQKVISPEEAHRAKSAPLGVSQRGGRPTGNYPAFLELVRRQLHRDYREEDLQSEGLRIFTTLDPLVQSVAEQQVADTLQQLEKRRGLPRDKLEAAVVVTTAADGEVLALVGGRQPKYEGFNRALDAVRPIGSLIKPVVYLAALERSRDYTLVTPLWDEPVRLKGGDGKLWEPKNYDHRLHGQVPLYRALAHSYNLATVHLGLDVGVEGVADLLKRLGIARPVQAVPALLLGAVDLTPLEVAQVYQSLAAGGFRTPLRAIRAVLDAQNQPLNRYPLIVQKATSGEASYLLTWAMQRVVAEGTGRGLQRLLPPDLAVAGKTGTTDEMRDSWFAGFSGDKVAVVWVGRDDNEPARLSGSAGALQVWGRLMAQSDSQPLFPLAPDTVVEVPVEPESGLRAGTECPTARTVPFVRGSEPLISSTCGSLAATRPPQPRAPAETQPKKKPSRLEQSTEFFRRLFEW